jgi:hypothetical protein
VYEEHIAERRKSKPLPTPRLDGSDHSYRQCPDRRTLRGPPVGHCDAVTWDDALLLTN